MTSKYRFEIIYQNKYVKQASDFLKKCDLRVGEIGVKEIMTFTNASNYSIEDYKNMIKQAYATCEAHILHIEGGKVE